MCYTASNSLGDIQRQKEELLRLKTEICGTCKHFTADQDHGLLCGSCEFKKLFVSPHTLCNIEKWEAK